MWNSKIDDFFHFDFETRVSLFMFGLQMMLLAGKSALPDAFLQLSTNHLKKSCISSICKETINNFVKPNSWAKEMARLTHFQMSQGLKIPK